MAYIVGTYNKYDGWDRSHSKHTFEINGQQYAIFYVELDWGVPQLPTRTDRNETGSEYKIYETYEAAFNFVNKIKQINN